MVRRAARAARGRRLESDLHLLPQHRRPTSTALGALARPGRAGYQGEVVDRLLPPERARSWSRSPTSGALRARASSERSLVGWSGRLARAASAEARRALLSVGMHATRRDLGAAHLVEVGIGCESCHGGSREHVKTTSVRPDLRAAQRVPARARRRPARRRAARAEAINRACARCHQVLFSRYPFTWEGGARAAAIAAGGSTHQLGRGARLPARRLRARDVVRDLPRSARARIGATSCDALRHARRQRASARAATRTTPRPRRCARTRTTIPRARAARCLACHMPRKNMGARLRAHALPPHRLADRRRARRAATGRSSARSATPTSSVGDAGRRRWSASGASATTARRCAQLYGAISTRTRCSRPLARGKPHEQAPAMAVLGEKRVSVALAPIARSS